jgi:hypothetical protein
MNSDAMPILEIYESVHIMIFFLIRTHKVDYQVDINVTNLQPFSGSRRDSNISRNHVKEM